MSDAAAAPSERTVKLIFCLLGVGLLAPWNAFINAKPYFQARLCHKDEAINSELNSELLFGLVYNISGLSALGLMILYQLVSGYLKNPSPPGHQPDVLSNGNDLATMEDPLLATGGSEEGENASSTNHSTLFMTVVPLSIYFLVFLFTTLLVLVIQIPSSLFLTLTLAGLAGCGMSGSIASAGIVATAGLFPSSIGTSPYFQGQALGGVAVSVANFIASALKSGAAYREEMCSDRSLEEANEPTCLPYSHVDWATFVFFAMGSVVIAACILGYTCIDRFQRASHRNDYESLLEDAADSDGGGSSILLTDLQEPVEEEEEAVPNPTADEKITLDDASARRLPREWEVGASNDTMAAWKAVKMPALTIFLTFFVTLSVFPSWTSELQSIHQCRSRWRLSNDLFVPMTFVIFNTGDLLGRLVAGKVPVDRIRNLSQKLVLAASLRFLFFPLFLLCVARTSVFSSLAIHSDAFSLAVQFLFAVLNGLLSTVSFMHAPRLVDNTPQLQERVSEILNIAVVSGLLSGSLFSFCFFRVATGRW